MCRPPGFGSLQLGFRWFTPPARKYRPLGSGKPLQTTKPQFDGWHQTQGLVANNKPQLDGWHQTQAGLRDQRQKQIACTWLARIASPAGDISLPVCVSHRTLMHTRAPQPSGRHNEARSYAVRQVVKSTTGLLGKMAYISTFSNAA